MEALPVLWVDESLLAVDKPAGLPTLPDGYDRSAPHIRSLLEPHFGRVWIVHRLDRQTSGVLVVARSAQAHRALNTQFDQHTVCKLYHALVNGCPSWEEKTVEIPLQPDGDRRHRTVPSARGKSAITHLRVLERLGEYTLLEAAPRTGRTHQIRAHLAALGFPLVADDLYGGGQALSVPGRTLLARCGLHAFSLAVAHPLNGQEIRLEAPHPPDLAEALATLRRLIPGG